MPLGGTLKGWHRWASWNSTRASAKCCTWVGASSSTSASKQARDLAPCALALMWSSTVCLLSRKPGVSWVTLRLVGQGGDGLFLFCPCEAPPVVLCRALGSQHKKDMELLERMFRGLEHLSYEGKLRDLEFFSLGKRRVWEDHTVFF